MMGQAPIQATDLRMLCASFHKTTSLRSLRLFPERYVMVRGGVEDCSCLLSPYSPQSHAIVVLVRQPRRHAPPGATAVWKPCRFLSLSEGDGTHSLFLCKLVTVLPYWWHLYLYLLDLL